MFNLNSFLTRFKRGWSGAPPQPPARRASASPYEGATTGRRLGNWVTTRDAINSVWYQSADQLVARSRDIVRKDGWAPKAVDEWVSNAIGTGIKLQSMHPNAGGPRFPQTRVCGSPMPRERQSRLLKMRG